MSIRQLLPEDAPEFQALRLRGLLEAPSAFSSSHEDEVHTAMSAVAQRLATQPGTAILGFFRGARLAGVVGIQRESMRKLSHKAVLWGMYVAPEHRRDGVGRALVERALEVAARDLGVQRVKLTVNTRNTAAIALYESIGFRTYGTEVGVLLVDGEFHDEHLMEMAVGEIQGDSHRGPPADLKSP